MGIRTVAVTRTYLQMTSPGEHRPAFSDDARLRVERLTPCPVPLYRRLYADVGSAYHWIDRLGWRDDEISAHLANPDISVWVLYQGSNLAGYFELKRTGDGAVEIAYFGLLPGFCRRGLGKHLLSSAVEQAWQGATRRVWLHTCTLDDPAALPNYLKRGFTIFRHEHFSVDVSSPAD